MKKKIFMLSIAILFLLTGCTKSQLISSDYNTIEKKIKQKDTFIIEVIQTGCSACKEFTPRFRKIINKYKIPVYQLNYTDLNKEDKKKFDDTISISSTPTVIFIKEGKESSVLTRIVGAEDNDKVIESLKSNGYIK